MRLVSDEEEGGEMVEKEGTVTTTDNRPENIEQSAEICI